MSSGSKSTARAAVELDVYSGIQNPTWTLSTEDLMSLVSRLESLPRVSERRLHTNLGYRGLIIHLSQDQGARIVRVQSGVAQLGEGRAYARDENRALERWLLTTGRPYVKPDLFEELERQLR